MHPNNSWFDPVTDVYDVHGVLQDDWGDDRRDLTIYNMDKALLLFLRPLII
jgi:hypothetical protein